MDHLENLAPNIDNPHPFPVDNSLNPDILALDNNLTLSFQDPILTASSEINLLTPEEDFAETISDFQIAPLNLNNPQQPVNFNTNLTDNGTFAVDETGKFTIDFLFDAGSYTSELAIFSLTGMEDLNPGSDEYIKEAARRALTNSSEGYTIIHDAYEGAKFTGELGESDKNAGNYQGIKTFNMNPGDNFALMLVPQSKVESVFSNPTVDGNKHPLFSLASANPDNTIQIMQLVEESVDGGVFGMEDLRLDGTSDADYNDIIFHVKGAVGKATPFQELGNSHTWDKTNIGKQLIEFARNNNNFDASDNPNAGKLEFEKAEFNTFELGIPTLSATIIRTDGNFGNVSATVHLTNGTAIANSDFDDTPIIVNFADGEIRKDITIPIGGDNLKEGRETVNLSLENLTGGATLGEQNTAVINIGDEDMSNIISSSSSEDSALSLDKINVFLKPGEELSFDITVRAISKTTRLENANNHHINIFPVDDNSGYIKDISLKKIAENNYTYTVNLLSDGTGGNQSITLRAEGYGDTTVNAITGLGGPFNRPPNPQTPREYLDPSILPVQGIVTGGSEEGVLLNQKIENHTSIRHVGFREVNNPINPEQTWVIIHGWNDTPNGRFTDLAGKISATNPSNRVLLLDWREAAYNNSELLGVEFGVPGQGNFRAGTWITPVAEFAVKALKDSYGIDSQTALQSLNLIGHSLGSLISSEMGRIYRDGLSIENETIVTGNNQGTRTITALEPPSARNRDENPFIQDPKKDIYDVDGRINGIQAPEKFADVSVFSRAYVGEKSIAGNPELAVTADEAFQMNFGTISEFVTDFGEEHYRVISTFNNMINQPGLIGDLLGIKAYKSIDKLPINDFDELRIRRENNGDYKGIIDVNQQDQATLLIGKSKAGKQDDIVIGSVINQKIDGSDFFNIGGDSRYTGNGNDIFFGGSGNDTIIGDNNDDILFGGIGKDKLNGGSGRDTFILKPGNGSIFQDEADVIEDFQIGIDKIGLIDLKFEQLTFQEFPSGLFGLSRDTAIIANSEILALLKYIRVEQIQKPEFFVFIDEDELPVT